MTSEDLRYSDPEIYLRRQGREAALLPEPSAGAEGAVYARLGRRRQHRTSRLCSLPSDRSAKRCVLISRVFAHSRAEGAAMHLQNIHSPSRRRRGEARRPSRRRGEGPARCSPMIRQAAKRLGRPSLSFGGSERCRQRGPKGRATGRGVCRRRRHRERPGDTALTRRSEGPALPSSRRN